MSNFCPNAYEYMMIINNKNNTVEVKIVVARTILHSLTNFRILIMV